MIDVVEDVVEILWAGGIILADGAALEQVVVVDTAVEGGNGGMGLGL